MSATGRQADDPYDRPTDAPRVRLEDRDHMPSRCDAAIVGDLGRKTRAFGNIAVVIGKNQIVSATTRRAVRFYVSKIDDRS